MSASEDELSDTEFPQRSFVTKNRRKRTKDEAIYGIFLSSDSDDGPPSRAGGRTATPAFRRASSGRPPGQDDHADDQDTPFDFHGDTILDYISSEDSSLSDRDVSPRSEDDAPRDVSDDEDSDEAEVSHEYRFPHRARTLERHTRLDEDQNKATEAPISEVQKSKLYGKGYALLQKMGYTGGGLGKGGTGIRNPLQVKVRRRNQGVQDFGERHRHSKSAKQLLLDREPSKQTRDILRQGKGKLSDDTLSALVIPKVSVVPIVDMTLPHDTIFGKTPDHIVKPFSFAAAQLRGQIEELEAKQQCTAYLLAEAEREMNALKVDLPPLEAQLKLLEADIQASQAALAQCEALQRSELLKQYRHNFEKLRSSSQAENSSLQQALYTKYVTDAPFQREPVEPPAPLELISKASLESCLGVVQREWTAMIQRSPTHYLRHMLFECAHALGLLLLQSFSLNWLWNDETRHHLPTTLVQFRQICFPSFSDTPSAKLYASHLEALQKLRQHWQTVVHDQIILDLKASFAQFKVNPPDQDVAPLLRVFDYKDLISAEEVSRVLDECFFPQWLQVLSQWLMSSGTDLYEIHGWYLGWRNLFPEPLKLHPLIEAKFRQGLTCIAEYLDRNFSRLAPKPDPRKPSSPRNLPCSASDSSEDTDLEKSSEDTSSSEEDFSSRSVSTATAPQRLAGPRIRLPELLEAVAEQQDLLMAPKRGRLVNGKQVYAFGSTSIYLDSNVIYLFDPQLNAWEFVSPERLLEVAKTASKKQR